MMMLGGTVEIPQELIDAIIDTFSSDRHALGQCSLVCKSWLPRSSEHLLRRVYWPPRPYRTKDCRHDLSQGAESTCRYKIPDSEGSFKMCISTLSSSPRLRTSIRDIELTSWRLRCMKHFRTTVTEGLDMLTLTNILDLIPQLKILRITLSALLSEPHPPISEKGYNIEELHIAQLYDIAAGSIPDLLSLFHSVRVLRVDCLSPEKSWPLQCPSPSALKIETLEFPRHVGRCGVDVLCRELLSRTKFTYLRRLMCVEVTEDLAKVINAAPQLQSLSLYAGGHPFPPLPPLHPASLTSVSLIWDLNPCTIIKSPDTDHSWMWTPVIERLCTFAASDLHEIVLSLWLNLGADQESWRNKNVTSDYAFEATLTQLGDWGPWVEVLDMFKSLRTLVIEIDFNHCHLADAQLLIADSGRWAPVMRDVASRCLPRKYVDILHVREVSLR